MTTWKQVSVTFVAVVSLAAVVLNAGSGRPADRQQPPTQGAASAQDPVATLKQSLQQGMAKARQYEWVETTIISLKGEEKARKQNRCYYGADGKVQKVAIDQPAAKAQSSGGGRRGGRVMQQVVENKKDDMKEYMEQATALIHKYVPPNPQQIQAAKDAGRVAKNPQPGGAVRLVISQYLQPGDSVSADIDPAKGTLLGLAINTYLEKPEDTVTLDVKMNTLPDGALYAGQTTLNAKAKNITVVIQNTGHRLVVK